MENNTWWKTLAGTLQTDDENRKRIIYYHQIARTWFCHETVDVLSYQSSNSCPSFESRVPVRQYSTTKKIDFKEGKLLGYRRDGEVLPRIPFPEEPENFEWRAGNAATMTFAPRTCGYVTSTACSLYGLSI